MTKAEAIRGAVEKLDGLALDSRDDRETLIAALVDALGVGPCAHCGVPSQGNYSIHRDGLGAGPKVALCDDCGGYEPPTCEDIWTQIRLRRTRP